MAGCDTWKRQLLQAKRSLSTCPSGKLQLEGWGDAMRHREVVDEQTGRRGLVPYFCGECGRWHLGRSYKKRKLAQAISGGNFQGHQVSTGA